MKSILPKLMSLVGVLLVMTAGLLWFTWKPVEAPAEPVDSVPVGSKIIMNEFFVLTFPPGTETSTADMKVRASNNGWKIELDFAIDGKQPTLAEFKKEFGSGVETEIGGKTVLTNVSKSDDASLEAYFVNLPDDDRTILITIEGDVAARQAAFEVLNAIKWKL